MKPTTIRLPRLDLTNPMPMPRAITTPTGMVMPLAFDVLPKPPKPKTIHDMPSKLLVRLSAKTYLLVALAWDYVDTVLLCAASLKIAELKPLCRTIKSLRDEYLRFRARSIDHKQADEEFERGLNFEDFIKPDLDKLTYALKDTIAKHNLDREYAYFILAVQQALTLMDAVKEYSRYVDKRIASFGIPVRPEGMTIVQEEFIKLFPLIPLFAGDAYDPDPMERKLTAKIIANRLHEVEMHITD